jgi:aspartate racemase
MKQSGLIGLIGGMSWRSTVDYYRLINELVESRLGGHSSARIALYSLDFAPLVEAQHEGRRDDIIQTLTGAGKALKRAGADFFMIGTNTMHFVADEVEAAVGLPLLHIADAVGEIVKQAGIKRVGLLGTNFTMEGSFYRDRLKKSSGIEVIVPNETDRAETHRIIYEELCRGKIIEESRDAMIEIINRLGEEEAEGVILGCTEIPILVKPCDVGIPAFDTTAIHARAAVERAMTAE